MRRSTTRSEVLRRIGALALTLLLFGAGVAVAQNSSGHVRVRVSALGRPVVGALVSAAGREAVTDAEGHAVLELPVGESALQVSAEGLATATSHLLVEAGQWQQVDVILGPLLQADEEVIVVASTRSERRLQDEPLRVEVVDREEIEEKALMTPGSVAMLLAETTGLRVQTSAPSTAAASVRIQGLRGQYTQMLSDGLPLYGIQGDALSLLQVPPLDLGRVEILKGPASALYGASALGGVINLVSQRPADVQQQVLLNASTQQAYDGTAWLTRRWGEWGLTALGGLHGQARQDGDEDGWADLPSYRRWVLRPRLFWDDQRGRSLFATVGGSGENRSGGTMPGRDAPDGSPYLDEIETRRVDTGAVYRQLLGSGGFLSARASFSSNRQHREIGGSLERGTRQTWFGEATLQGFAGSHVWVAGAALQRDDYDARDLQHLSYRFTVPGLFAQDEIALSPNVTLGASARLDFHDRYGTFLSPRLSALLRPADAWTVRLSAGSGFFAPTPFLEDTQEAGLSRLLPLTDVRAERARGASADVSWARGPVEIHGTLYASRVRDPVQLRRVRDEQVALVNAEGPTDTVGTELLVRYRRGALLLLVTHGHTWATEDDPETGERREVPLTPRHAASFNAIWEDEEWGRVGLETYYIGRQALDDDPYRDTGADHLLVGVLAEKRFGNLRVFFNAENLGNVRQTGWAPLVRPSRARDGRWTVDAWAPLDGRVFNGGVRFVF